MTKQLPNYPECGPAHAYRDHGLFTCPKCDHEWSLTEEVTEKGLVVKDSDDSLLADGDSVTVIKDSKVKGTSDAIKQGTEMKNIRLAESDHNIDCKADGSSPMKLKSKFVKKN